VPSVYGWWNHWPVTPVPGDGRWVVNNDQPSHFNLTTFTQWKDYAMNDRVKTRVMLHGVSSRSPQDLVPLARSWLQPPRLELQHGQGRYEPAERAYLLRDLGQGTVDATLFADREHPAIGLALVLNGVRSTTPVIHIDGAILTAGKDFQHGTVRDVDQWKTILWFHREFLQETKLRIAW
jgi:hypothetical protein